MMSMKKAALELDAALPTRRALGTWAAVEIMADMDTTPSGTLIAKKPSDKIVPKQKPATLPRPNSSFLHSFINSYNQNPSEIAAKAKDSINNSLNDARKDPSSNRPSEDKKDTHSCNPSETRNEDKMCTTDEIKVRATNAAYGIDSVKSTVLSGGDVAETVVTKSSKDYPPAKSSSSASLLENNDNLIVHEKSLEFPGKEEKCHPTSCSLSPPSSREKEEGQTMNPDYSTDENFSVKDHGMICKGGEEEGPLTSVAVSVDGGGSEGDRGEMAEEERFCTGCPRISPSPSLRSLQTPSPFSHLPTVPNSVPKKPSFRVVRRRDSRRKDTRRHHAMTVLPSSKVATLASKFNALILEKEGTPSQSKTGPRLYRTLPSQKTSGAMVLRRRGLAYIPGESDLRRQGRKRSEEAGSRKSEGELPKRSPSSLSTGNIPVALKAQRSSATSVKDAIKIIEDNLRTRPPVPRKPKLDGSVSPKHSEAKKVVKPSSDLPRLLVATKIEVYHPESVSSVIEAIKTQKEVIEIEAIDDNNSDSFVTSENSYVNLVQSAASDDPIEEPKALPKDSEENDGGYEPVSPAPLSDPPVPGVKLIHSVKPNSSFLWGSQPLLCPASSSLSSSLKKLSLPEKPESQSLECLTGYDSLEDEEDGYDDIGPPSEPKAASEGLGPECEVDSLGGYESFSVPESESRESKDVGIEGRNVGSLGGRGRKSERMGYEGFDGVYDDVRSMNAAASKADTTSVSNCYESIYCGEGGVCSEESRTGAPRDRRSVSSEESRGGIAGGNDSLSGIELESNSLYGMCGSTLSDSGESHNSEVDGPHEVLSYKLTSLGETVKGCGEAERRSDTSDDWVDVEASDAEDEDNDSEGAVVVCRERIPRGRGGPKWSKKVRREYSRRSRKSREGMEMETEQHHYETLYELVGSMGVRDRQETCTVVVQDKPQHVQQPNERQHALPYENLSDDDFDSFDSDMSDEFDDQVPTKELPSIPVDEKIPTSPGAPVPGNNTNGITKKVAEVAGKKLQELRRNWSIRKHLTRSLKLMRQKSGSEYTTTPTILTHPQPPLPPTPDCPPPLPPSRPPPSAPPPPLPPERSISNVCPPLPSIPTSNPPPPLNKSVSSGNLSGRKYWSFKSHFGRRASASTSSLQRQSSASPNTSPSSSTFYITGTVNADTGLSETSDSSTKAVPQEKSPGNNIRWSISGDDMLDKPKGIEEKRKSISSKPPVTRRSSMRPRGPPPPPPNAQNLSPNIQNGENRNGAPSPLNVSPTYAPPSTASSSSSSSSPYAFHCNRSSPTTSWFTDMEDGLQPAGSLDDNVNKKNRENKMSTVSWYADIGLWTSKNAHSTQENGRHTDTSDSSSSNVASPEGSVVNGQFVDEPLYQFYTAAVAKSVAQDVDYDSDGYEEIGKCRTEKHQSPRPKAMDLVRHKEGCRTLWCQIPEVLASGLLDTFNAHQKKIQEAKFEVVTSEASYLKSLSILVSHFVESHSLNDENLISKSDREILFSNVLPVKHCSERFMAELERCWQEDILLLDICEIIRRHAEKYFKVYVNYCSNQVHLDRALHRLKKSSQFLEIINALESHPVCQSLSLHSFLMLPMQRVTRLPLLVDAILRRMPIDDSKYGACKVALATLNKVVQDCNEGARHAERLEEMKVLSQQLDFREVGSPSLLSGGRWLVRKGELVHLHWRDDPSSLLGVASTPAVSSVSSISAVPVVSQPSISTSKLTFGRKMVKQPLFLFLFTDLLVITKKKSEDHYVVLDFCLRNLVEIVSGGLDGLGGPSSLQQLPPKYFSEGGKNIFLLSMLQNHENRTVEMVLSSSQESDKERWLEAFTPASSDNPDEQVYEEWDCPQVAAVHHYVAQQPDELSLEISDVVNVLRKLSDGWYLGERIRDGEKGWFPANHCTEIASSHVRAKNLRQRYRLLALSGDYLEQQRRERALAKAAKKKKSKKESKKE